jgi:hypothetical protein
MKGTRQLTIMKEYENIRLEVAVRDTKYSTIKDSTLHKSSIQFTVEHLLDDRHYLSLAF